MSLFGLFKGNEKPVKKDRTLVCIEWDRVRRTVNDLSFVGNYPEAKVWVFVNDFVNEDLVDKMVREYPFEVKTQPDYEHKASHYLIAELFRELYANGPYTKVVFVCADDFLKGTADYLRELKFQVELKIFSGKGQPDNDRGRGRNERGERGDRQGRGERGVRNERGDRSERQPRGERQERGDRADRNERGPKQDRLTRREPDETPADGQTPENGHEAAPRERQPRPEPAKFVLKRTPGEYAVLVVKLLATELPVGTVFGTSKLGNVVKSATELPLTELFGRNGSRILLAKLEELGHIRATDAQHYELLSLPPAEVLGDLIRNKEHYNAEAQASASKPKRQPRKPAAKNAAAEGAAGEETEPADEVSADTGTEVDTDSEGEDSLELEAHALETDGQDADSLPAQDRETVN